MAPRANWKGYLKLSLVSCAVALYPAASTSDRIAFNTISRKTGHKVKRIFIDPDTGDEVTGDDQAKGYPVAKDTYVLVEDEEIDAVRIESSHTIDIQSFVPRHEIDPRFMDTPYYITPDDKVAQEAFAVIREAMRSADVVGLGRVVIARRERIVMLEPWERGLLGTMLRYGAEVRASGAYFEEIPTVETPEEMMDLASVIIKRKLGHFEPDAFKDRYEEALTALVKAKQEGREFEAPEAAETSNVVDLMEALRRSIGGPAGKDKGEPAKGATKGSGKAGAPAKTAHKAATPAAKPASKSRTAAKKAG